MDINVFYITAGASVSRLLRPEILAHPLLADNIVRLVIVHPCRVVARYHIYTRGHRHIPDVSSARHPCLDG